MFKKPRNSCTHTIGHSPKHISYEYSVRLFPSRIRCFNFSGFSVIMSTGSCLKDLIVSKVYCIHNIQIFVQRFHNSKKEVIIKIKNRRLMRKGLEQFLFCFCFALSIFAIIPIFNHMHDLSSLLYQELFFKTKFEPNKASTPSFNAGRCLLDSVPVA